MGIKIVHVSDTHLRPFNPEPGDILVHSGDALNYGHIADLIEFRDQLIPLVNNYKHIVFTPGNHDRIFEEAPSLAIDILNECIPNLTVLHNQSAEILGHKFYGTGDQPAFCNWAFNKSPEELIQSYSNIPDDVEVLITHCPPKGILDVYKKSLGAQELTDTLPRLTKLKAVTFGHIHSGHGLEKIGDVWYSNGALVGEDYNPTYRENVIELH